MRESGYYYVDFGLNDGIVFGKHIGYYDSTINVWAFALFNSFYNDSDFVKIYEFKLKEPL